MQPRLKKRNKTYYVHYNDHTGKVIKKSLKVKTIKEANKKLAEMQMAELIKKPKDQDLNAITIDDLIPDYLEQCKLTGKRSYKQIERTSKTIQAYYHYLKNPLIVTLKRPDIQRYLVWRKSEFIPKGLKRNVCDGTLDYELKIMRAILKNGIKNELITHIPSFDFDLKVNVRQAMITHAEYDKLLEVSPEFFSRFISWAYTTGQRYMEIANMQWKHLNKETETIILERTKSGKPRIIPLNKTLKGILKEIEKERNDHIKKGYYTKKDDVYKYIFIRKNQKGNYVKMDYNIRLWKSACKKANINDKVFHSLRKSAITRMIENGIPQEIVKRISGIVSNRVFETYQIFDDTSLKNAMRKLDNL